jgi:hypothetical protein
MTPEARQHKMAALHRRLWFLRERLNDVTQDPALTARVRREKATYYTTSIAEARAWLLELEGH